MNPLERVRTRTIAGKEYRIHKLSLDDLLLLEDWVNRQFEDPIEVASKALNSGLFNVAQQQYILKEAMALATKGRRKLGTPEADEKASSMEGVMELLYISLIKGDPSLKREDIAHLSDKLTPAEVLAIMSDTDADKVIEGPKAPMPDLTPEAFGPASGS